MKPQQFVMLVIALGCGLGAMVMTQKFLNKKDQVDQKPTTPVVVATGAIGAGQVIDETMIRVVSYAQDTIPEGAITDPAKVIGKSSRYPLSEKQIIVEAAFPEGGGKGISAVLEQGKRALTVPTTADRAVAGFIKPNDHVDIILNVKSRGPGQLGTAKTILQDVRVLAVDSSMRSEGTPDDQGKVLEMVTFLLTPDESELMTLAQNSGNISMVLRNPGDTAVVKTKGASLEKVLSGDDSEEEESTEPEKFFVDNNKSGNSGGLMGFLGSIVAKQKEKEAAAEIAEPAPIEQIEPVVEVEPVPAQPQKQLKWLVYRDVEGNELMRVLVDADSDIAASLKDQLEDAEPAGPAGNANAMLPPVNNGPVAFPGKRS